MDREQKNYEWKPQLKVGKQGELVVSQWLRQNFPVVADVRGDFLWRSRDVDFLVSGAPEAKAITYEVKTDTYDNCRLFFELFNGSWMPGALLRSRADYWLYYKAANGILFRFHPHYVAAYIMSRLAKGRVPLVPVRNQRGNTAAYGVNLSVQELFDADPGAERFVLDGEDNHSVCIGLAASGVKALTE